MCARDMRTGRRRKEECETSEVRRAANATHGLSGCDLFLACVLESEGCHLCGEYPVEGISRDSSAISWVHTQGRSR
jgi:hypothetical protein